MAIRTEIEELMNNDGIMFDVAEKVEYKRELDAAEKEIAEISDAWAKEIGKTGKDPDCTIAEFINRTVNEEVYNAPDELLDQIFDRGSIGEFDDTEGHKDPKNTLIAHEAAKGGTVDRSYIDISVLKPTWKNRQVETDISYVDLRKNGFKSIATLTTFMKEACQNALFYDALSMADAAVNGGEQLISVDGAVPTLEAMDALSLYLNDRGADNVIITLSKYAQAIRRMEGFAQYLSGNMKDDFNRYGLVKTYDGIGVAGISGAKKTGNGSLLLPDKRIYGIADHIGSLDMKGEIHTYQDMNNQSEKVHIMLKDFTYGFMLTNIENFAKVTLSR
uniref:Major capsid protein n=1 Tax=Siphoviridae sp. ctZd434 TaxID=2825559 RepID=A0A8S5UH88_9CAUD|nr:MAG TPA: Major capsid protein [Siphoviridae sp. ctZd434]